MRAFPAKLSGLPVESGQGHATASYLVVVLGAAVAKDLRSPFNGALNGCCPAPNRAVPKIAPGRERQHRPGGCSRWTKVRGLPGRPPGRFRSRAPVAGYVGCTLGPVTGPEISVMPERPVMAECR